TVNGIIDLYAKITAPQYVQTNYSIYYGVDQLLHTHTGSYSSAVYTAWIHMMSGSGGVTVTVSKQSTYFPQRVTEILTQDIVSSISGSQTQIPMSYSQGNGGIISNMIQVNPTKRNYTAYSNGIRIGNNSGDSSSSLYLGCANTAIDTTQAGQWEISKTNDKVLTITPSSLRQDDHSVGLSSSDSFAGVTCGNIQLNPSDVSYGEGIRISNSPIQNVSAIYIGTSTSSSGEIDGQWTIIKRNAGELYICRTADQNTDNRGLQISADGNTLTFNGRVL
ncbi:MAG: hypothetical protein EZS28_047145, partial [Streblomastix strix]